MRTYSTGALSKEAKEKQNRNYDSNRRYDYLLVGSGMSSLAAAALLANAGYRVCILEAHDQPGGYAHTFQMNGYEFCAMVHYIWGCAPGQAIHQFLKHLGLEQDITFEAFDPNGYDIASLPNGQQVKVPYGFDGWIQNLTAVFPDQRPGLERFFQTLSQLRDEIRQLPETIKWWQCLTQGYRFRNLIQYRNKTLQDVFNECRLSQEVQTVLSANAGDLGLPPKELSVLAYTGLVSGYSEGAYYPTKHFKYMIERIAQFITNHYECHLFFETEVTQIHTDGKRIVGVSTADGKVFQAENYICNMDPQKALTLIPEAQKISRSQRKALSYDYSPASVMTYVGVKDIDLRDYGLTNANIWHLEDWDMNAMWEAQMAGNFDSPWFFLSSPSLRTEDSSDAPEGGQTLEFGTLTSYAPFHELREKDPAAYRRHKKAVRDRLLDIIEERYIPDLRQHLGLLVTGSPTTNEDFCWAPFGNCYGSSLTPENMGFGRLKSESPWENLSWCNASSGYPGIHGTILTGSQLYTQLTGDRVIDRSRMPSSEEAIASARQQAHHPQSRVRI